jgi:AraC-like DNA-binding protein
MSEEERSGAASTSGRSPPQTFSTDQVASRQRQAYWKEAVCDAIANVDVTCLDVDAFSGRVRWRGVDFGGGRSAILVEAAAMPLVARRGARQLARDHEPFLGLTFQRKGRATIEQAGQNSLFRPGDINLLDGTQRYKMAFEDPYEHVVLKVPYERLAPLLPAGGHWRGRVVSGASPLGGVLNAHMNAVAATLDRLDSASQSTLLETTIGLIALAFTDDLRKFAGDAGTVRRALILRAMQFIAWHLADPGLSATVVAAALGVSTGYLQHAFQGAGTTVGAEIRRRRLERCRDDLADPLRAGEHIGEIALRWGFRDIPHFSRAFKRQFGVTPREHRALAAENRGRRNSGNGR